MSVRPVLFRTGTGLGLILTLSLVTLLPLADIFQSEKYTPVANKAATSLPRWNFD